MHRFSADLVRPLKSPRGEIPGRIPSRFIDDRGQHIGAVSREPLACHRMFSQCLHKLLRSLFKKVRVFDSDLFSPCVIYDNRFQPFRSHHRSHSSPSCMAGRSPVGAGDSDTGHSHLHLPGRPGGANLVAAVPPTLLSLIPPVKGLLAPMESLPELAAVVPVKSPGAITSLLCWPIGLHVGETSLFTTMDVSPRPP